MENRAEKADLSRVIPLTERLELVQGIFAEAGISTRDNAFNYSLQNFFAQNMIRALTLEDLGVYMGLNKDYCGYLCRQNTGYQFGALYLNIRIAFARKLLQEQVFTVAQIGRMLGYSSPSYFITVFQRETGMSPKQYQTAQEKKEFDMIELMMKYLTEHDPEVGDSIRKEYERQCRNIELIASENIVSKSTLVAAGSVLTNKYAEGYPGKRYYGGCSCVDVTERIAQERAQKLYGAKYVNVQPHSGAQANYAVYQALCQIGDTVMGMNLDQGGHLTHGSPVNFSGKNYHIVSYGIDPVTHRIDYDKVRQIALKCRPKMIIAGASAYPRIIDFARMSEIAHEIGAYFMVDMAHIAGLVAAGLHPSPVPFADVVTTTTHKTLRGPRGGMILCNDEMIAKKMNSAVFPGTQGGPLEHIIAAKAVALGEALTDEFKAYQTQIVKNAQAMADEIIKGGLDLVSGGTDNHLMLVDLRAAHLTGKEMERRLDEICITVNKNAVPNDPEKPFVTSGIRIGTPAVTTRGFLEEDCRAVARIICEAAGTEFERKKEELQAQVMALTDKYPLYLKEAL